MNAKEIASMLGMGLCGTKRLLDRLNVPYTRLGRKQRYYDPNDSHPMMRSIALSPLCSVSPILYICQIISYYPKDYRTILSIIQNSNNIPIYPNLPFLNRKKKYVYLCDLYDRLLQLQQNRL